MYVNQLLIYENIYIVHFLHLKYNCVIFFIVFLFIIFL